MALKLRDPETSAVDARRRRDRRRAAARRNRRRRRLLRGVSLLLAFIGVGLVLLLNGGLEEQEAEVVSVSRPDDAGSPAPETAPDFDTEALRDRLDEIVEGREGVYGVVMLEPDSGTKLSLRDDEKFMAASIGKLPVFAALYRAQARGELDLDEEMSILPKDIQEFGFSGLHGFPVGHSLSLRECAYRLVNHSDNTAWAMLDRRLGAAKIRAELQEMGVKNSLYADNLSGYFTTPNDVLLVLEKISDPRFTSEKLSDEMLEAMTETVLEDRIPDKLPRDVRVAHKTGSYEHNFGDAGVVLYKDHRGVEKRYYLVVLAKDAGEYEARDVIQNMSLAVYEALTGARVDPGWSRVEAARRESGVDDASASWPSLTENTEGQGESAGSPKFPLEEESMKPPKSPLGEKSLPENQPAPRPGSENVEKSAENKGLPKSPPDEKSSQESRYNVVPDLPANPAPPLAPAWQEPVEPGAFAPVFPEEDVYQEDIYQEEETEY